MDDHMNLSASTIAGDLGCRVVHYLSLLLYVFVLATGGYGFVSCGSDLGFKKDNCSSDSARVITAWSAILVAMITLVVQGALLGQVMKLEKRDGEHASHDNRLRNMTVVGSVIFSSFIFMIIHFAMAGKASSLADGTWFHLQALSFMETLAGCVTCVSMLLYVMKLRRVYSQRDQVYDVLNNLEEYADEGREDEHDAWSDETLRETNAQSERTQSLVNALA